MNHNGNLPISSPGSNSTNNNNPPNEENPILKLYEGFVRETPFVTRCILQLQVVSYLLSFFVDTGLVLGNIPHFTIYKLEIYRIFLSSFLCSSFMTLIFGFISLSDTGKRMECQMGSAAYGLLLATLGILVNMLHLMVCFVLDFITDDDIWLFVECFGIWIIIFGLLSIECSKASSTSVRRLFVIPIPTRYYPLALLGLFVLLGGSGSSSSNSSHRLQWIPYLWAIGIGFAIRHEYLDVLEVDSMKIQVWEQDGGYLHPYTQQVGWIRNPGTSRRGAWNDLEISSSSSSSSAGGGDGMGMLSRLLRQSQQPQHGSNVAPNQLSSTAATTENSRPDQVIGVDSTQSPSFPTTGGRALGTTSRRSNSHTTQVDTRQARLEALERRMGTSTKQEDDQV